MRYSARGTGGAAGGGAGCGIGGGGWAQAPRFEPPGGVAQIAPPSTAGRGCAIGPDRQRDARGGDRRSRRPARRARPRRSSPRPAMPRRRCNSCARRRPGGAPPSSAPGRRSAQPSAPLSSPAEGRTGAVARVEGRDRCDPEAGGRPVTGDAFAAGARGAWIASEAGRRQAGRAGGCARRALRCGDRDARRRFSAAARRAALARAAAARRAATARGAGDRSRIDRAHRRAADRPRRCRCRCARNAGARLGRPRPRRRRLRRRPIRPRGLLVSRPNRPRSRSACSALSGAGSNDRVDALAGGGRGGARATLARAADQRSKCARRAGRCGSASSGYRPRPYAARYTLEATGRGPGGTNRTTQGGATTLRPGERTVLLTIALGAGGAGQWQAVLTVTPAEGAPYRQERESVAAGS